MIMVNEENIITKEDTVKANEPSFDELIQLVETTSKILKEQKHAKNIKWLKEKSI